MGRKTILDEKDLQEEAVLSIVSSADIDDFVLHLYALARQLKQKGDRSFEISMHVMLKRVVLLACTTHHKNDFLLRNHMLMVRYVP